MRFGIREIVFILLLGAIPLAAWWFAFRPGNARNAEMMRQIEARQAKLRELNKARATIGDLESEIKSLQGAIEFFRSKLPSQKEMDKVLQEVWQLAEANHLTTKSIRTLKPGQSTTLTDPNGPYAEQPISIQLESSFMGFYGFLLALERQPRIMRILDVDIRELSPARPGRVAVNCLVCVFFERSGAG